MPYKRKRTMKKRFFKRSKRSYRRRYRKSRIVSVPGRQFLPTRFKTQFTYTQRYNLTSIAGGNATQIMRGNSCYDPDQTSTGSQPQGWDLLTGNSMYTKYTVIASKIEIEFFGNQVPFRVVVFPLQSATSTNVSFDTCARFPRARTANVGNSSGGAAVRKLKNYARTRTITNLSIYDDSLASQYNANPTTQWYWQIVGVPIDGASSDVVFASVTVTYYTILHGYLPLNFS